MEPRISVAELTLYKLVLAGTIRLDEAKVLKCLWAHGKLDLWQICDQTGVEVMEIAEAMKGLHEKGILRVTPTGYEVEDKEAALVKLVEQTEARKRGLVQLAVSVS